MLVQLHHQNKKTGHCEFAAQTDINKKHHETEMQKFVNNTRKSNPLPEDCIWMVCNEKSPHFLLLVT